MQIHPSLKQPFNARRPSDELCIRIKNKVNKYEVVIYFDVTCFRLAPPGPLARVDTIDSLNLASKNWLLKRENLLHWIIRTLILVSLCIYIPILVAYSPFNQ